MHARVASLQSTLNTLHSEGPAVSEGATRPFPRLDLARLRPTENTRGTGHCLFLSGLSFSRAPLGVVPVVKFGDSEVEERRNSSAEG